MPVIFIGILSKKLNDDYPEVISEHAIMNTKYKSISSRHMIYYLVELEKFDKKDKFFLVGYNNASFDNQFFRAFFVQNNDMYFGSYFWFLC